MESARGMKPVLVLGGTGKTGSRVVKRLERRGVPVRVGSRTGDPPFDWEDEATWAPALQDVESAYVSYYPDIAMPGAVEAVRSFAKLAVENRVGRLVLPSGRGEAEGQRAGVGLRGGGGARVGAVRANLAPSRVKADLPRDYML